MYRNLRESMLNLIEQHIQWDSVEESPVESGEASSPSVQSQSQESDLPVSHFIHCILWWHEIQFNSSVYYLFL